MFSMSCLEVKNAKKNENMMCPLSVIMTIIVILLTICLTLPPLPQLARRLFISALTVSGSFQTTALVSRASLSSMLLVERLFVVYGMKSKLGFSVCPHSVSTLIWLSLTMSLDNETRQTGLCLRYNPVSF
jgi:hypothetical protein